MTRFNECGEIQSESALDCVLTFCPVPLLDVSVWLRRDTVGSKMLPVLQPATIFTGHLPCAS